MIRVRVNGNILAIEECTEIADHLSTFCYYNHDRGLQNFYNLSGPKIHFRGIELFKPKKMNRNGGCDSVAVMKITQGNQIVTEVTDVFGKLVGLYVFLQRYQRGHYCGYCKRKREQNTQNNCPGHCFFKIVEQQGFNGRAKC